MVWCRIWDVQWQFICSFVFCVGYTRRQSCVRKYSRDHGFQLLLRFPKQSAKSYVNTCTEYLQYWLVRTKIEICFCASLHALKVPILLCDVIRLLYQMRMSSILSGTTSSLPYDKGSKPQQSHWFQGGTEPISQWPSDLNRRLRRAIFPTLSWRLVRLQSMILWKRINTRRVLYYTWSRYRSNQRTRNWTISFSSMQEINERNEFN